jgi:hydrogenase maturation protease
MSGGADTVLLYGFGNPGRGDDGLGPALAAAMDVRALPGVVVDANYQLTVEDAAEIAEYAVVVFVDAAALGRAPFWFYRIDDASITSARALGWSSHSVNPPQVVALARELFQSRVAAYTLAIRGYSFGDFDESLSAGAQANLTEAVGFVRRLLSERDFDAYVQEPGYSAAGIPGGLTGRA